jgi:molybdopterin converting factor small subunit
LVLKEASIDRDILSAEDVLVAVDQTVVTSDFLVRPGSEVAFFPPVTGG